MDFQLARKRLSELGIDYWLTVSSEGKDPNSEAILGRKVSGPNFILFSKSERTPLVIVGKMEEGGISGNDFRKKIVEKKDETKRILSSEIPEGSVVALNFSDSASCDHLTKSQFDFLRRALPGRKFVSSEGLQELRAVRSKGELRDHRKAIEITGGALESLGGKFAGLSEREIALSLKKSFLELGGEEAFETIVASGPNSANPHHVPTGRIVGKEEALLIDFGAKVNGSCADITRTVWTGKKPSKSFVAVYSTVLACQEESIEKISAGKKGSEINDYSVNFLKGNFPEKAILHSLGHSLGFLVHEVGPGLYSREKRALLENQIVTVEPGLYFKGKFGVRIEDDILVKGTGWENLSKKIHKELY